ncbi:hypothetical protein GALL_403080 [mine drainage metagenome]|uniref:Uncharacterized protein n=1 Tax=mine drainage metagenome TaxID=410659 RepID=A0A1J5QDK4_9ZZZZ
MGARRAQQRQSGARAQALREAAHITRRGEQALHVIGQRRRHRHRGGRGLHRAQAGGAGAARQPREQRAAVLAEQQRALGGGVRVAQRQAHQEAVELRLGQRVGAALIDRVLRGDDEKALGQRSRRAVDADLALLHRFEQRALRLRRRAVDLVGQQQFGEHRPGVEHEALDVARVDADAEHVAGQQVGGELHARVLQPEHMGQRVRQRRLADPGQVLDQQVAGGDQAAHGQFDLGALADQHRIDSVDQFDERCLHCQVRHLLA